jgi:hypothetical protein
LQKYIVLCFGLNVDVEVLEVSRESANHPFAKTRIDEVQAWLYKLQETTPLLNNPIIFLVDANPTHETTLAL